MKKESIALLWVLLCGATSVFADSNMYAYHIDLVHVENDQVAVELLVPAIKQKTVKFQFPKIVPGTYSISDFGRFISKVKAYDASGKLLPVEHPETNTWVIENAKNLHRITYLVDDTYDALGEPRVSGMAGTNIQAGKNFLINGSGFFGYFEGMKFIPFKVTVQKPEDFYGASAYLGVDRKPTQDTYLAKDYHHLVDMPMMYNVPDKEVIQLGGTEVLISVYSPSGNVEASFLKEQFTQLLNSQKEYLDGNLPVRRYAFIMYFMEQGMTVPTGALEHNYCSVYCLPDYPQEQMAPFLVDIAAHEFFHILTPLTLHSEEIHYFDFNEPEMSEHLWLYEGVTEYFADHNQVKSGLIDAQNYLDRMGQKIQNSQSLYQDDLPFTELSSGCLGAHGDQYGNVYEKGALIAMCLDIELLKLSNGQSGLIDLVQDLGEKYGTEKPFKDKKLFKAIQKESDPSLRQFFDTYVEGPTPIPYEEYFKQVGVEYIPPKDTMIFTLGGINIDFNPETSRIFVVGTYSLNAVGRDLGYQIGDELVEINGQKIPAVPQQIGPFITEQMSNFTEGETLVITVDRKSETGLSQQKELKTTIRKVTQKLPPQLSVQPNSNAKQELLRRAWIKP